MLDFSILDNIKKEAPTVKELPELPEEPIKQHEEDKKGLVLLQRQQTAYKSYCDMLKVSEDHIKRSELLRSEILKEVKAGADKTELFLKAIEAIYLITGDKAFYNTIIERVK